jgi:hypothetical protein
VEKVKGEGWEILILKCHISRGLPPEQKFEHICFYIFYDTASSGKLKRVENFNVLHTFRLFFSPRQSCALFNFHGRHSIIRRPGCERSDPRFALCKLNCNCDANGYEQYVKCRHSLEAAESPI